nr:hypothetical protein [Tanacetum cinerariifolium]
MDIEENLISSFARKRLCIKTKQANNILEKFKVIFKGNVYMAHAKELFTWTLIFLDYKESEYISDKESLHDQFADMDRSVSRDEIRVAVWNCDENKSLGPSGGSFSKGSNSSFIALILKVTDAKFVTDFRPTSLIRCVYKVVTKILANSLATVISDLVSDIQLAFVANIQILDGPLILNELLAWCKRKKKATSDGLFKGIQIQGSIDIFHLFYVDDAVFIGEWSDSNLDNIVKILKCFFLASGLKINIQKSQVLGVGVPRNIINQAASLIGCTVMQNPFRYLGVMKERLPASLGINPRVQEKWRSRSFKFPCVEPCSVIKVGVAFSFSRWVSLTRVRDGHNTRFWYDSWVFDQPLRVRFPRLFALEMDKESMVASKLGSSSVDASFRRSVRERVERQQ